ncbi:transcriptional regulator [Devosia limi DSM 17137]|uniref:DNA-binding response regulator, OmpR family, contains REC and winged-helix (WHTH) domain n=1 Tax=Devosia limi DSM 17137 TaxID=1121477 RepID=A0A0F5LSI0_9HYPH|nr:response regulator transcription factor [Devosia limi]KKB85104.1 transcriptional regulator [Devosia limi DSM 17137]SHF40372.1 DNA-binding response regulator, OmpR family, contains REC and winged-helix (wHTH) domain [Devosia limi DSM 17137]
MRLLLVEDEPDMAALLRTALEKHDFVTDCAPSIEIAIEAIETVAHDLVILDRQLGDGDGASLIAYLRKRRPNVPIVILSARGSANDRVEGLNLGADDYLPKPFEISELVARLRAVLRRPSQVTSKPLSIGNLSFDLNAGEVFVDDERLDLPRREYLVLESLMRRAGRTVRRGVLEEEVYGSDDEIASNSLEAHISRLRRKLTAAGASVTIHPVRGVGYLLKQDA